MAPAKFPGKGRTTGGVPLTGRVHKTRPSHLHNNRPTLNEELAELRKRYRDSVIDDPVAIKVIRELNVSDYFFSSGKVLAWALQPDDPAFSKIYRYVANSEWSFNTNRRPQVEILSILRIIPKAAKLQKEGLPVNFNEDPQTKDMFRMMLWHGTRKPNVRSILETGLRLPPSYHRDEWFGQGIYFSDSFSNSMGYTEYKDGGKYCYLFLCEVLLGEMYHSTTRLPYITAAPTKSGIPCDSVKGYGWYGTDVCGHETIDGCLWPLGRTTRNNCRFWVDHYNEYIVYNQNQVQPKYLVKIGRKI